MRREGRVEGAQYVLRDDGGVIRTIPIDEARGDKKLLRAIERNGWGKVDG